MATYTIIPSGDGSGFHIGVAGSDVARQTMLGFASIGEAEAWILQDKRLNNGGTNEIQRQETALRPLSA